MEQFNDLTIEAQDLNQQGMMLLKVKNISLAKEKFDKAIELDPMLMDSYKNYGDLYMEIEEYENAKNSYKKALLIEKNGLLHFLMGCAYFMNDEPHEGLEQYNFAITAGYDSDEMMFYMGMAYEYLNDDEMALRYFQKATVKNPSRHDYLIKKIDILIKLNMTELAEKDIEKLLLNAPEMYDGYHFKTQMLISKNNLNEAVDFSKQASEKFPEDVELYFDYVNCLTLINNLDMALNEISIAKKMKYFESGENKFTLLEAQILAQKGNFEQAVAVCKEFIKDKEDSFTEIRFTLLNLFIAQQDYNFALDTAQWLVNKKDEDVFYYASLYYIAFCNKKLGNIEIANKLFKEANSFYRLHTLKNPSAIDVYLYRAMCLKELEEYDKAFEMLDFVSGIAGEIAEIHTIKYDIYKTQGRNLLAQEELQKAYKIKPELKETFESQGE